MFCRDDLFHEKFIETRHGFSAKHLSKMHGFKYSKVSGSFGLKFALNSFFKTSSRPKLLEINTNSSLNVTNSQTDLVVDFRTFFELCIMPAKLEPLYGSLNLE